MESLATAIGAESDMELLGVVSSPEALAATVRRGEVDVLITESADGDGETSADDDAGPYTDLLYDSPRLRVLTIALRGPGVVLHELRPHRVTLGNVSLNRLLETIRGNAPTTVAPNHRLRGI
jgi:hypothetical protein